MASPDRRVREFLATTLAHWNVDARVEPLAAPRVAEIRLASGEPSIVLERAGGDDPFRWYLHRVEAGADTRPREVRPARPCGSLVGVLSGLRRMLGIASGATMRVARDP